MSEELKKFFEENSNSEENVDDIWKGDDIPLDKWELKEEPTQEQQQTDNNELKPLVVGSKTIEIKDIDELYALAKRGLEIEEKYNRLSNYQDVINIIDGIGKDKVALLSNAIKGDVGSKKELLKLLGEESIELDFEEEPKKPQQQNENPIQKMFDEVAKRDPELSGRIIKTIDTIDPTLRQVILSVPKAFEVFIKQVEDGSFNRIYPVALKIKAKEPHIDWGEAFKRAIEELKQNKDVPKTPSEPLQDEYKKSLHKEKKDDYDSIWNDDISDPDEIERLLIEEI